MRIEQDKEIKNILKIVAPGTNLREGLENILRAKTGGLIVLGDNEEIMKLVDGGFKINSEYTPSYVYELAKMDGAIVVSSDFKKIVCANAQLVPDSSIPTFETGTRHRTAHRVAKMTGAIAVAISQRRNMITVYKGDLKYVLRETSIILARANQAIQTLEKYVAVLDRVKNNLNLLEFQDLTTLFDVVTAIQRTEMASLQHLDVFFEFRSAVRICETLNKKIDLPGVDVYLRYDLENNNRSQANGLSMLDDLHLGRICCNEKLVPSNKCKYHILPHLNNTALAI